VRVRTAFLRTTQRDVPWRKVTGVQFLEGPLDRILGLSTVRVEAYGTAGTTLVLTALSDGAAVQGMVERRMVEQASLATWLGDD